MSSAADCCLAAVSNHRAEYWRCNSALAHNRVLQWQLQCKALEQPETTHKAALEHRPEYAVRNVCKCDTMHNRWLGIKRQIEEVSAQLRRIATAADEGSESGKRAHVIYKLHACGE